MIPSFSHDDLAAMLEELEVLRDLAEAAERFRLSLAAQDATFQAIDAFLPYVEDYAEYRELRAKRRAAK